MTHCALEKKLYFDKIIFGSSINTKGIYICTIFLIKSLFLHENAKEETKMTKEERDDKDDSSLLFFRWKMTKDEWDDWVSKSWFFVCEFQKCENKAARKWF